MPKTFAPKPLTEEQVNVVNMMSLTGEQPEMLQYDDTTSTITDGLGAAGYAYDEGFIGVSEFGIVTLFTSLDELLANWGMLK